MAALEDADRKAVAAEQEQSGQVAALEAQVGTQDALIATLTGQAEALAANDATAQAEEAAQGEVLAAMQGRLDTLNQRGGCVRRRG